MYDKILDGKKLADELNLELQKKVKQAVEKTNVRPKLATILVGEDPGSKVYVNIKQRTSSQIGIETILIELDKNISKESLMQKIKRLNEDNKIHAILLQFPLPKHLINEAPNLLAHISPDKDADGLTPLNRGKLFDYNEELAPCTPRGIIALLEHYNIELKGKYVVIVNRSNLVGKPLIFMLLKRNATVSICHTSTQNIDRYIKNADILIVAVGKPNFITKEMIKEDVVIIDVGINRLKEKICGDVDFKGVLEKCSKITPVPGGIGPLTVSFLFQNTFTAYKKQLSLK
ncbi:MAG: bifunctional 5,10-methylenetetrahydrofolate dehydrogenase/5,10-methenyltetrahydrofolate cyclohydrolase [Promethearchaeota archaeon]